MAQDNVKAPDCHGSLGEFLAETARFFAGKPFLDAPDHGVALTYDELGAAWARGAALVRQRGLEPGDRAFVLLGNGPEFLIAFGSLLIAGVCPILANPGSSAEHLRDLAAIAEAKGAVGGAVLSGLIRLEAEDFSPAA